MIENDPSELFLRYIWSFGFICIEQGASEARKCESSFNSCERKLLFGGKMEIEK